MQRLESYLGGRWVAGSGDGAVLVNPSTEEPLARTSSEGLDLGAALAHGRQVGGAALRAMTFAERGAMLGALSEAVVAARNELLDLSMLDNGCTRSDAKFDVDGASFTLAAYAELGQSLGDRRYLVDGEAVELVRSRRLGGLHIKVPRPGVAVHINAYNFPAWGLCEKAAVAWLAGMPVLSKPATSTASTAHALARALVGAGVLPEGAFGFLAGPAGDLIDRMGYGDVLAFTGSSQTGRTLRTSPGLVAAGVPVNVEADSVNAAVLGPDVVPGDAAWDLMVRDVFRDMTQKTGQKCTAIRRVLVPEVHAAAMTEALVEEAGRLRIGDPREDGVRMGPVVSARQRDDVLAGIQRFDGPLKRVRGQGRPAELSGVEGERGYFVDVHVFRARDAAASHEASCVHDEEIFGPVATVLPYDGTVEQAVTLVARGRGSLVTSLYSEDRDVCREFTLGAAAWNGRVNIGSEKVAEVAPGPGTVLPQLVHGGPGRAGGGEELGGLRGLDLYMQRTAIEGYRPLLERLFDGT
ncbi:MAG: 3,4-dehydroadipyl-CoA semialdehyde dehydrogenase [Deltaproteobacteria bacterium]|nr:3,4-dehydroadipyl-CoA semialdehyde dehydrogenase [Deltaproteobacteria bacterium]